MKKTEIIEKTIDLLAEPEWWTKRLLHTKASGTDAYCLMGAINMVVSGNWGFWATGTKPGAVVQLLGRLAEDRGFDEPNAVSRIVQFNNAADTTHEDILLFLKEALYDAQAEETRNNTTEEIS